MCEPSDVNPEEGSSEDAGEIRLHHVSVRQVKQYK